MNHEKHFDILWNLVGGELDLLHIEIALELADESPWLRVVLPALHHHHRIHLPHDGQRAHHADDRFFRNHHSRDKAETSYREAFALGLRKAIALFLIEHLHSNQDRFAPGAQGLGFDTIEARRIFRVRIGRGVKPLDFDFPLAACLYSPANLPLAAHKWRGRPALSWYLWCNKNGSAPGYRVWPEWLSFPASV